MPESHFCIAVIIGTEHRRRLWCGKWHIKFDLLYLITLEMIPIFSDSTKQLFQWCFPTELWADTCNTVKCIRFIHFTAFFRLFCSFRSNKISPLVVSRFKFIERLPNSNLSLEFDIYPSLETKKKSSFQLCYG